MARANKKVRMGLKNAHYAVWDEAEEKYATPVAIPGAVTLSMSREGDESDFYADDDVWTSFETNNGYSGELEVAVVEDQLLIDLLGFIRDKNGTVLEPTDAERPEFALLYEQGGNKDKVAYAFYNCSLSRPETSANTKSDSTDPDTSTLNIRMKSREFDVDGSTVSMVKGHVNSKDYPEVFNSWFNAVTLPTGQAATTPGA